MVTLVWSASSTRIRSGMVNVSLHRARLFHLDIRRLRFFHPRASVTRSRASHVGKEEEVMKKFLLIALLALLGVSTAKLLKAGSQTNGGVSITVDVFANN